MVHSLPRVFSSSFVLFLEIKFRMNANERDEIVVVPFRAIKSENDCYGNAFVFSVSEKMKMEMKTFGNEISNGKISTHT